MNLNTISFEKKNFQRYNFKKYLGRKDSLIWKNCSNLEIIINSKINKLILTNCDSIKIIIGDTISGVDLEKSTNIKIYTIKNQNFKYLSSFKSNTILYIHKLKDLKNIILKSEKSKIKYKFL